MITRRHLRLLFLLALFFSAGVVAHGAVTAERSGRAADVPTAPPTGNVTVATESARYGTIVAWHPNGTRLYYDDARTKYFDVDPVEGTETTVEYAATDTVHTRGPTCSEPPCALNLVERANLSTGETEVVYARYDARERAAEWHDHERVDETHVLVADMIDDQVFLVDTETEMVEWLWDAQSEFPVEGGGPFPEDWAHLNDVDRLADGRVMVSLRNQDQVVFLDPETGMDEAWTLGSDGDLDTLYEQHNPDYIPGSRGGPAVVVADSERGRVVEYQREDGTWNQSWEWSDDRMQWPRDADRLPNGNTLVADTHGSRLLEIAPNGSIVWSVPLAHPYDVERLGTGEDSAGGESAASLGLASSNEGDGGDGNGGGVLDATSEFVKGLFPAPVVNGVIYVAPIWVERPQFFSLGLGFAVLLVWPPLELRWRFPDVGLRSPLYRAGGEGTATGEAEGTETTREE